MLALAMSVVLAACQTPAALDGDPVVIDSSSGPGGAVRSPAAERAIGGIAELVLTNRLYPTFEAARENRIESIEDGSPLYAYIRATRPLGEIAHPPDPAGRYSFSDYPHLQLQVGDNESLRILTTCYVTMTEEEARRREIVVPLAPLTYRPGQVPADCWLDAASAGRSGPRTFEIRLAGFPGKFERWLPVPDLMAVVPLATDFRGGAGEYATMLRATPMRSATVVASAAAVGSTLVAIDGGSAPASPPPARVQSAPSEPPPAAAPEPPPAPRASVRPASTLMPARPAPSPTAILPSPVMTVTTDEAAPTLASLAPSSVVSSPVPAPSLLAVAPLLPAPRQEIGNSRMELQLRTLSAAILGRQPSDSYFVERHWTGINDSRGRVQLQQAEAAAIFRGETCSWQRLVVTRRPNATTLADVAQSGDPIAVNCADLP